MNVMNTANSSMHACVRRILAIVFVALLMVASSALPATACPMCKEALSSGSNGGDIVSGYFWSILFMMSMPFALIGSFGFYAYLQVRKARKSATLPE